MDDRTDPLARHLRDRALELPAKVRAAFLAEKCARDEKLAAQVRALLFAAGDAQFAPAPADATMAPMPDMTAIAPASEQPGTRIGPYELLQKLGEGGFGAVFLAQQHEPVQRQVALKVIKLGMDTRQVVARFEQERQALAMMDHPHIAKVLDAGATAAGRPYFVMELCKGEPIVAWCDKNRLTVRERLALFTQVCQAVQHAHGKGIIHRDLKPSNVLVGMQDGAPSVKVIDFGIAKATAQKLTDLTLFTEAEQVVGTPLYMSPEQAEGSLDIDTRTDVYSLGVVLYELLTGTTPFDQKQLRTAMASELKRMIREVEPARPSTRIANSRETLAQVATMRRVEPQGLGSLVRGELDWIVMKAIEKDRRRRYETASELATDVQRFLTGEAVLAAPPSASYRLRKFLRRNRAAVTAAAAVAAALLAGVVAFAWQAHEAGVQRDLAVTAQRDETKARQRAEDVAELMESLFHGIDPNAELDSGMSLRDQLVTRLDGMTAKLAEHGGDPLTRARLQVSLAQTLLGLSEYGKAEPMLREALATRTQLLGAGAPETEETLESLAGSLVQLGRSDEAATLMKSLPPDSAARRDGDLLLGMVYRAAGRMTEAIRMLEACRDQLQAKGGPDTEDGLLTLHSLAAAYRETGRTAAAIPLFEDVLRRRSALLGADHPDTLTTANSLAVAMAEANRLQDALALHEDTRRRLLQRFAPDHMAVINCETNLAFVLGRLGRTDEAITLLSQAHDRTLPKLRPDHPAMLRITRELARLLATAHRITEAVALIDAGMAQVKAVAGSSAQALDDYTLELARCHAGIGEYGKAADEAAPALDRLRRRLGDDDAGVLTLREQFAMWQRNAGRPEPAIAALTELVATHLRLHGENDPATLTAEHDLACCYFTADRARDAIPLFEKVLAGRTAALGPDDANTLQTQGNLGAAYWRDHQLDKSVPLLQKTLAAQERVLGAGATATVSTAGDLLANLRDAHRADELFAMEQRWLPAIMNAEGPAAAGVGGLVQEFLVESQRRGDLARAAPVLALVYASAVEKAGPDHPRTLDLGSNLGTAYWFAKDYAHSVPLLTDVVARSRRVLGDDEQATAERVVSLAVNLRDSGRAAEALPMFEDVVHRARDGKLAPRDLDFWVRELAKTYYAVGRTEAGKPLIDELVARARSAAGDSRPKLAAALGLLGANLVEAGAFAEAEPLLRESFTIRQQVQPTAWNTFLCQNMLGRALHGLHRDDEAKPLLEQGCVGLRDHEADLPADARHRLTDAVDTLLAFYLATGATDDAKPWQEWRASLRAAAGRPQ